MKNILNKRSENFQIKKLDWNKIQSDMKEKLGSDIYESWLKKINFVEEFKSLDIPKDSNIYFICKSGMRSNLAANMIENEGYKSLFNVEDGFTLGWKPTGLPSVEY